MDDLISRSKAIQWVKAECNPYGQPTLDYESGIKVIEYLERMSSAQPEPVRRGRWIDTGEIWTDMYTADEDHIYKCSVCNVEVISGGMAYCSNCGARMEDK